MGLKLDKVVSSFTKTFILTTNCHTFFDHVLQKNICRSNGSNLSDGGLYTLLTRGGGEESTRMSDA